MELWMWKEGDERVTNFTIWLKWVRFIKQAAKLNWYHHTLHSGSCQCSLSLSVQNLNVDSSLEANSILSNIMMSIVGCYRWLVFWHVIQCGSLWFGTQPESFLLKEGKKSENKRRMWSDRAWVQIRSQPLLSGADQHHTSLSATS